VLFARTYFKSTASKDSDSASGAKATAEITRLAKKVFNLVRFEHLLCDPESSQQDDQGTAPPFTFDDVKGAKHPPLLFLTVYSQRFNLARQSMDRHIDIERFETSGRFCAGCGALQLLQPDGAYGYSELHYTVDLAFHQACAGQPASTCANKPIGRMWEAWQVRNTTFCAIYV